MTARLLAILIALAPTSALAQAFFPCPSTQAGWAKSWPPPITGSLYDTSSGVIYFIFYSTIGQAFSNVPTSIMQTLSNTNNPSQVYSYVASTYHQILLSQKDNCPLHWEGPGNEGKYIWTENYPTR